MYFNDVVIHSFMMTLQNLVSFSYLPTTVSLLLINSNDQCGTEDMYRNVPAAI